MNKKNLIKEMAARSGIAERDAEKALNSFCDVIGEELENERKVMIMNFGTFAVHARAGQTIRNPRTGECLEIAESKAVSFKAGKHLKKRVKGSRG